LNAEGFPEFRLTLTKTKLPSAPQLDVRVHHRRPQHSPGIISAPPSPNPGPLKGDWGFRRGRLAADRMGTQRSKTVRPGCLKIESKIRWGNTRPSLDV